MIDIRFATAEDAPTIFALVTALAHYEREPDAVKCSAEDFRLQLAAPAPPFECLLAERDGVALGFALFFHNYSTWRGRRGLYLEDLFVPKEHRGAGIGKALLVRLARVARERDCARMEWAVLDWNEPAIGFYEALGAKPMSDWTTFRLTGTALERLARS
jgi:GNAT superfamily N-acetyltransferase